MLSESNGDVAQLEDEVFNLGELTPPPDTNGDPRSTEDDGQVEEGDE
jgi:hypothetical protein